MWSVAPRDWADLQEPFCLPLWRDTLAALRVQSGTRFLDAGCGGGGAASLAAGLGAAVTGLDASEALLAIARERVPAGSFIHGDLEKLPFPDGTFDAALAANSVIFAEDIPQAVRELRRVLRPGGRVAITSWGKPEECEMRAIFAGVGAVLPKSPGGGGPFAWSADGALAGLLAQAGLTILGEGPSVCDFHYADLNSLWRAQASSGNYQPALNLVGADRLRQIVAEAVRPLTHTDGTITLKNIYRWAVAQAPF